MPEEKGNFWATLPGLITAIAGLLTAVAGLIAAINGFFVGARTVATTETTERRVELPSNQQVNTQATTTQSQLITAWIYYEVGKDGKPTRDGQLEVLPTGTPLPDFRKIKQGTVLRTLSPVNMRQTPPDTDEQLNAPPLATLRGGSCVRVLSNADPKQETEVSRARSGGWLQVSTQPCPTG